LISCIIIACDHGLGHIRRSLLLANKLSSEGWDVHLFTNEKGVTKLKPIFGLNKNIKIVAFSTNTTVLNFINGKNNNWHKRLPQLEKFDIVISDNLPEILEIRPDTILCGSFLWHLAIENINYGIIKKSEKLLYKYRPIMIASSFFINRNLYKYTDIRPIGLCVPELPKRLSINERRNLLITCGMSGFLLDTFRLFVKQLANDKNQPPFKNIWVDSQLLPEKVPDWMKEASFTPEMYLRLKAVICRPGVGTLTDSLWGGARVFCISEKGNQEMEDNSEFIIKAGVGEKCKDVWEAYHCSCLFLSDAEGERNHSNSVEKISFSGIYDSIQILNDIYKTRNMIPR